MTLLTLIIIALLIYFIVIQRDNGRNNIPGNKGKKCPNCNNPIEDYFNVCPVCKETLKTKCVQCNQTIEAGWTYCPYCEATQRRVKSDEDNKK